MDSFLTSFPINLQLVHSAPGIPAPCGFSRSSGMHLPQDFCFPWFHCQNATLAIICLENSLTSLVSMLLSHLLHHTSSQPYPDILTLFYILLLAFLHSTSFIYLLSFQLLSYQLHHNKGICQFCFLMYLKLLKQCLSQDLSNRLLNKIFVE